MMADYDSPHDRYESEHHQQQQLPQQQQQQRSTILERGRAIKLLRNGDRFFSGRAFVINHRKYPMLEVLLDDASQALRANFGAVRCIHTPKNGTRLHDISELEDHQTYVASGGERFKKLHYLDIAEGKRVTSKEKTPPKLPPVRRYDVEGRAMRLSRSENVIIYVYRNGDPLTLPAKILLVKATLQNWESVLDEITRKVSLTNSAVLKLYSMNGELVTSAQQLEYNGMYVAAGKERFKRIEYPDPKSFSPNSSPKMSRKSYTKSDGSNTHTATANSHGSIEHNGQRRPVREEYDFFNSKPQQHRRGPTKETDLDRDDGGIYKGRLNHRERVREIEDTRDTKVELPVDYREVETVEEENLYGNAGRTPRRQPQPQPPSQPKANSRQRSPPARTLKTPPKTNHHNNNDNDDDNDHHNQSTNGFDNDSQRRTPSSRTKHIDNDYKHRSSPPPPPRHIDDDVDYNHQRDNQQTPPSRQEKQRIPSNTHSNDKDENHAATVIQSHVRGYLTRKQTYHDKQDHNDQLTKNDSQRQSPDFNNHKQNHEQHSSSRNEHRYDNDDDDNI